MKKDFWTTRIKLIILAGIIVAGFLSFRQWDKERLHTVPLPETEESLEKTVSPEEGENLYDPTVVPSVSFTSPQGGSYPFNGGEKHFSLETNIAKNTAFNIKIFLISKKCDLSDCYRQMGGGPFITKDFWPDITSVYVHSLGCLSSCTWEVDSMFAIPPGEYRLLARVTKATERSDPFLLEEKSPFFEIEGDPSLSLSVGKKMGDFFISSISSPASDYGSIVFSGETTISGRYYADEMTWDDCFHVFDEDRSKLPKLEYSDGSTFCFSPSSHESALVAVLKTTTATTTIKITDYLYNAKPIDAHPSSAKLVEIIE